MVHEDEWRRRLNRAVREFAARGEWNAPGEVSVLALLREIGEALAVPCTALVRTPTSPDEERLCYQWCLGHPTSPALQLDAAPVQALIADVTRGHLPLVVPSGAGDLIAQAGIAEACASLQEAGVSTAVVVPTGLGPGLPWTWVLGAANEAHSWPDPVIDHLRMLGAIVAGVLQRVGATHRSTEGKPQVAGPATTRPAAANERARGPVNRDVDDVIGQAPALRTALSMLEEVIDTNCTVLLLGETGTGKELFARALHKRGPRRAFPLVSVNCAALPPTLIESELFGHQRGAFTGAVAPREGRFELAHRGTLFLDEIGDMALDLQAKLLRVLQEGAFERVGSSQTRAVDVRIVAATHHDLERSVAEGTFRADLYYRLNVFPIRLPPLRERREDIPALVWNIIARRQAQLRRHITHVPLEVWEALQRYSWPGNIRELQNVIEGALIHSTTNVLTLREGRLRGEDAPAHAETTLTAVDRVHIERVLRECSWRINGTGNAAERLGLHPNTLRFRIKKLGILRSEAGLGVQPLRFRSQIGGRVS